MISIVTYDSDTDEAIGNLLAGYIVDFEPDPHAGGDYDHDSYRLIGASWNNDTGRICWLAHPYNESTEVTTESVTLEFPIDDVVVTVY